MNRKFKITTNEMDHATKCQGFSNILVPGTPFRGKKIPRTPLIFITVIEHNVNV